MIKIDRVKLYTGRASYPDGCVLVDGDRITYAGPREDCPMHAAVDQLIDGRGAILMPGLYNAHCHAAMVLLRGVGSDLTLMDWLNQIFPLEDKLTGEYVYWGTMHAIQEMIRRGVVAFADMYFFMDQVARAALETGIRVNLARGCLDRAGIDSVTALHGEFDGAGDGCVKVYMGLHGEYTTEEPVARYAVERARALGTGLHVHVAETRSETDGCIERHGVTPVKYFDGLGAFEVPTIAAHCVHLTDEDVGILAKKGVYAVHNPSSNLKLASGIAPVDMYLKRGVRVALGTDGASSNNCLDMISDMRLASLLQKGAFLDPTLMRAEDTIAMATRTGALAMGYADCGLVEKGMQADMIMLNGQAANLMPCPDLAAAIVYAAQGLNVTMTMVRGKVLYRDGQFTTMDCKQVSARALEASRAIGV